MTTLPADRPRRPTTVKDLILTVLRALRSTLAIGVVALGGFALRTGRVEWVAIKQAAAANGTLALMVFLGMLIWDYWTRRAN